MAAPSSPHSLASSLEDDNDDVNTASARVYFGPLQSPEKKFTSRSGMRTPVRRSARISQLAAEPASEDDVDSHSSGENSGLTDSDHVTPIVEVRTFDESQGSLFSQTEAVLSGSMSHDPDQNMSKDTRHPEAAQVTETVNEEIAYDTDNHGLPVGEAEDAEAPSREGTPAGDDIQDEPSSQLASRIIHAHDNPSPPPATPVLEQFNAVTPSRPTSSSQDVGASGQDLINFDSFTIPTTSSLPPFEEMSISPRIRPVTVDDLLAPSPEFMHLNHDAVPAAAASSHSGDEENQVLLELSRDVVESVLIPELVLDSPIPAARLGHQNRRHSLSPVDAAPATPDSFPIPTLVFPVEAQGIDAKREHDVAVIPSSPRKTQDVGALLAELAAAPPEPVTLFERQDPVDEAGAAIDRERSPLRRSPRKTSSFARELGSLSPGSADMLAQLLPNMRFKDPSPIPDITIKSPARTPQLPPADLPSKNTNRASGSAHPPATPARTPARRVPLSQAVVEGTVSPQKAGSSSNGIFSKFGATAGTSSAFPASPFKRAALDDPLRSPAKRVPISEALTVTPGKGKAPVRAASPLRVFSKEPTARRARSASAEPTPLNASTSTLGKRRIIFKPQLAGLATKRAGSEPPAEVTASPAPLPYPITARPRPQPSQPSIPEVDEDAQTTSLATEAVAEASSSSKGVSRAASAAPSPAKASPRQKSSLRQPTASSRIPRIGVKPYARPKPAATAAAAATAAPAAGPSVPKAPTVMRRAVGAPAKATPAAPSSSSSTSIQAPRPMRIAQGRAAVASTAKPSKSTEVASASKSSPGVARAAPSHSSPLKRKREEPTIVTSGQPVVLIRKVVPGMFGNRSTPSPGTKSTEKAQAAAAATVSPAKASGPVRMRRVVDWKKPAAESSAAVAPMAESVAQTSTSPTDLASPMEEGTTQIAAQLEAPSASNLSGPSVEPPAIPPPPSIAQLTNPLEQSPSAMGTRRSTRSRRSDEASSDVFGTVAQTTVRPLQPRKKRPPPETSVFQGMSAVALRALTLSNTTKNQQQVASLETEIIHKGGLRPESPTSRARTALEKAKEVKAQERRDRAARRAKRVEGGDAEGDEAGDSSVLSVDADGVPLRHQRGPGDEDDYDTPERPEPPLKRGRIEGTEMLKEERRVKWDRGLAVMFYLDDTPPTPHRSPDGELVKKGCLTPAAKTLRLDTLGNVLNAEVPVDGLIKENVVIKKFVYDDDPAPAVVEPETPPPAATKTRSKGKKAKT